MAASELSGAPGRPAGGRLVPAELPVAWLQAYRGVWAATLAAAALVAIAGQPLISVTRRALALTLTAQHNPPPQLGQILALAAHNVPIAAWPLLLGLTGADRHRLARALADCAVLACIIFNTVPVGAALAAYGTALIAYLPQLPLEWAGLALGTSSWLVQRRRALSARERLAWLGLTAGVLLCAAALEGTAVPHR
jgi:hypothetical protein